jgi:hypothetical protein
VGCGAPEWPPARLLLLPIPAEFEPSPGLRTSTLCSVASTVSRSTLRSRKYFGELEPWTDGTICPVSIHELWQFEQISMLDGAGEYPRYPPELEAKLWSATTARSSVRAST